MCVCVGIRAHTKPKKQETQRERESYEDKKKINEKKKTIYTVVEPAKNAPSAPTSTVITTQPSLNASDTTVPSTWAGLRLSGSGDACL